VLTRGLDHPDTTVGAAAAGTAVTASGRRIIRAIATKQT
jgi:hypothetical protein